MNRNTLFFVILLLLGWLSAQAQLNEFNHFRFIENKGQHPSDGLFISPFPGGEMIIRSTSLFYHFHDANKEKEILEKAHHGEIDTVQIDHHSFMVEFLGANKATIVGRDSLGEVRNYIKGNDPEKWVQRVRAFQQIDYLNIYPNTDLSIFQKNGKTKYEFVARPGSKPHKIRLQYTGASKVYLNGEQLVIQTTLGNVIEDAPFVYQTIGDKRVEVDCHYVLKDSTLRYKLGKYDKNLPLIIDPKLIFSTSSGSLADNWGNTACYDRRGNLYTGGTLFEATSAGGSNLQPNGFPTTLGAFQRTYQGGETDMGIMKFDSSGTFLHYSTIIGGSDAEIPTSTVVNENNELYILGTTSSPDFPMGGGGYDTQFKGSFSEVTWLVNGVPSGTGNTFNSATLNPGDQVQAQLTSGYSCSEDKIVNSNTIRIKQPQKPEITISSADAIFCPGDLLNFTATSKFANTPAFQWLVNGLPVGTNSNTFSYTTPAIGDTVQVVLTDNSCNPLIDTDTSKAIVLVSGTTPLTVSIASDSLPICSGGRYTFSPTLNFTNSVFQYSWQVNGVEQATTETFTTTTLNNGDAVQLIITNNLSCAGTPQAFSNTITVNNAATPITHTAKIVADPYSSCDQNVTLRVESTNSGNNPQYQWYLGGITLDNVGSSITNNRQVISSYNVQVRVISSLGCATPNTLITPIYRLGKQSTKTEVLEIVASNDTICGTENINFQLTTDPNDSKVITTVGGYKFNNGTDIVVIRLKDDGTAILNATYVGGVGNDGLIQTHADLTNNYGDQLRGDINLDSLGNVYVASTSSSIDFPVVNAAQPNYGGGQSDGVLFKMNPTLSTMLFSTYIGGSASDGAFSVQTNRAQEVYIGGGTTSPNFPTTPDALITSPQGDVDGFVGRFSADGSTLINSTRLGTPAFDQTYFVQVDTNSNVYALGQTKGQYPVFKSKYSNPNSGLFVQKLSPDLSTSIYSTVIGSTVASGPIIPNISPSAFLVNECENIFISGWGGAVNNITDRGIFGINGLYYYISSATSIYNGGNTFNMPTTPGAYQTTTDGSDFYLAALLKDADSLLYATYFGGASSQEHVDGGTSRFDSRGIVYQSVCSGCGGNKDFPMEPKNSGSSYPRQNASENCNNGVFKFDLANLEAAFKVTDSCLVDTVTFLNHSNGGVDFTWDFGDGNSAFTLEKEDVTHVYKNPGVYEVILIVTDLTTCTVQDTARATVVISAVIPSETFTDTLCLGQTEKITVTTLGMQYSYKWSPSIFIDNDTVPNPTFSGTSNTSYLVTITDTNKCVKVDTFDVTVLPVLEADFLTAFDCNFQKVIFENQSVNGNLYVWDFGDGTSDTTYTLASLSHVYKSKGYYSLTLKAINDSTCNKVDYKANNVVQVRDSLAVERDTTICKFKSVQLEVTQGKDPIWENSPTLSCTTCATPIASPLQTTTYYVSIKEDTCVDRDSVIVTIYPDNTALAVIDAEVPRCYTDTVYFKALLQNNDCFCCERPKGWFWDFGDGVTSTLKNPQHKYNAEGPYDVSLTIVTSNDTASVIYPLSIYHPDSCLKNIFIPNAFSPNDDLSNDILYVRAINITQLEFRLFNRWGEEVFYTNNKNHGWNGVYKGTKMSPQVFTYICKATFWDGEQFYQEGNVTLLE